MILTLWLLFFASFQSNFVEQTWDSLSLWFLYFQLLEPKKYSLKKVTYGNWTKIAFIKLRINCTSMSSSNYTRLNRGVVSLIADGKNYLLFIFMLFKIAVHCRTLHPIFRKIAEKYRDHKEIVFARMDLSSFKPVDLKVILHTYLHTWFTSMYYFAQV